MADIFQNPGRKPGTAVLLRSNKGGTGKSFVSEVLGYLIGASHAVMVAEAEQLTGKFNAHLRDALLIRAEEATWAGDPKAAGLLRALITGSTTRIEPKGIDSFEVSSHCRLLLTSNAKWVFKAAEDERRYAVFEVGDAQAQNKPYFAAIEAELRAGGYERLMWELLHTDLSGFDVRTAPNTSGLIQQKLQSLGTFDRWWYNVLRNGTPYWSPDGTPQLTEKSVLFWHFEDFEKRQRSTYNTMTREQITKRLKELVSKEGVRDFRPHGSRRLYLLPPLNECRASFERFIGGHIDWDD